MPFAEAETALASTIGRADEESIAAQEILRVAAP